MAGHEVVVTAMRCRERLDRGGVVHENRVEIERPVLRDSAADDRRAAVERGLTRGRRKREVLRWLGGDVEEQSVAQVVRERHRLRGGARRGGGGDRRRLIIAERIGQAEVRRRWGEE